MLAKELRDLDAAELTGKLADCKRELFNLKIQRVSGEIKNPKRIGQVRKTIARILTVMQERTKQEVAKK